MIQPVTLNVVDGGLGYGLTGTDGLHVKIGIAEKGDTNKLYSIGSKQVARNTFGKGPLVDSVTYHFDEGGIKCFALRPDNDIAGSIGQITHSGSGSATMQATGTPTGARQFVIEIVTGGACETATYRWSEDGGINFSDIYTTPASGTPIQLSCGISISFSGTGDCFVKGDRYSFSTIAPQASAVSFLNALDAVKNQYNPDSAAYTFIHIVGGFERSFWEAVKAKEEEFEDKRIFVRFILEYPPKDEQTSITEYLQTMIDECKLFTSKKIGIVGGRLRYGSDTEYKSAAILLCAKLSQCKVNEHPGYVRKYASKIATEIEFWNEMEEYVTDLDDANVILAVKYANWPGIYIKKDHCMAAADSDYQTIHQGRVIDKVCRIAYQKIMPFVNGVAEGGESGIDSLIAEIDAAINSSMRIPGDEEIVKHEIEIDPDQDLSSGELKGQIHIYPTNIMERITIDIGYRKE
ncbi:MAG: DUF2586 family protein [Spirochaetota bacterium]|nr:DUF2586 family protein [Spirochaetota bacterium]